MINAGKTDCEEGGFEKGVAGEIAARAGFHDVFDLGYEDRCEEMADANSGC